MKRIFSLLGAGLCLLSLAGTSRADLIKQSSAYPRVVLMTSSTDHVTGATGLTLTVKVSKAGGAFATISPTVTDLGGGRYSIALVSANTDTFGPLDLQVTASGADPTDSHDQIVAFDPADPAALGLSRLDAAVSSRNAVTPPTVTAIRQEMDANSTQLAGHTTSLSTLTTRIPGTVQPQTGDAYARLGAPAGASISADIAANLAGINGVVSGVLNATAANYNTAGSIGAKINTAASAGAANDPWANLTSTSYNTGTFGALVKSYLDAAISSRLASGNVTVGGYASGQDPATLIWASTPGQKVQGVIFGTFTRNVTTGAVVYTRPDGATFTLTPTYNSANPPQQTGRN